MVNLKDMKDYLRVDSNEEDILIQDLIDASIIYIDECCGNAYKTIDNKIKLADIVVKKLVADMYEDRGSNNEGNIKQNRTVTTILEVLADKDDI